MDYIDYNCKFFFGTIKAQIRDQLHVFLEVRNELQDKWLKCNTRVT
jgi:hypothetical protein